MLLCSSHVVVASYGNSRIMLSRGKEVVAFSINQNNRTPHSSFLDMYCYFWWCVDHQKPNVYVYHIISRYLGILLPFYSCTTSLKIVKLHTASFCWVNYFPQVKQKYGNCQGDVEWWLHLDTERHSKTCFGSLVFIVLIFKLETFSIIGGFSIIPCLWSQLFNLIEYLS